MSRTEPYNHSDISQREDVIETGKKMLAIDYASKYNHNIFDRPRTWLGAVHLLRTHKFLDLRPTHPPYAHKL